MSSYQSQIRQTVPWLAAVVPSISYFVSLFQIVLRNFRSILVYLPSLNALEAWILSKEQSQKVIYRTISIFTFTDNRVRDVSQQPTQPKFTWYRMAYLFVGRLCSTALLIVHQSEEASKCRWVFRRKSKKDHFRTPFKVKGQKCHKCRMVCLFVSRPCFAGLRNEHQSKECVEVQVGHPQEIKKKLI